MTYLWMFYLPDSRPSCLRQSLLDGFEESIYAPMTGSRRTELQ